MFQQINQRFTDFGKGFAKLIKPLRDKIVRNISDEFMIQEIITLLCSGNMYYSHSYDLTNSQQQQKAIRTAKEKQHVSEQWAFWNHAFWWNEYLQIELLGAKMNSWMICLVQGFVEVGECSINGNHFNLALISRRSRNRAGLRYERRGADSKGYCANYVETEQIVIFEVQL